MKHSIVSICVLSCLLCACGVQDRTVSVKNPTAVGRTAETISVPFDSLGICGLTAENAVVKTSEGKEIPSQTVTGQDGAPCLIFQTDMKAESSAAFVVSKGKPQVYDTLAWSRYVPERKDDYAYENNIVVGRIYGPALAAPRTFGPDVWIKNTPAFIFDKWLAGRDFHHNHGEGMDCYMVGKALGGGACAPVSGDKIFCGDNWATQQRLCNGPLRTEAEFTYPAIDVDGRSMTSQRSLSLDANTRLVHWTTSFSTADGDSLDVVVGAVLHDIVSKECGPDYISFTEWASDSKQPQTDGLISLGLILSDRFKAEVCEIDSHACLKLRVASEETVEFWTASGWDQGGVESPEAWNAYMKEQAFAVNHPLEVVVEK